VPDREDRKAMSVTEQNDSYIACQNGGSVLSFANMTADSEFQEPLFAFNSSAISQSNQVSKISARGTQRSEQMCIDTVAVIHSGQPADKGK